MATFLKQSTAVEVKLGPFLDEDDGKTPETTLTISQADVRLAKNGGDWAQKNEATSMAHEEFGWYRCLLDTTDTDTVGILMLAVLEDGALPVWREFHVVVANVYDSLFGAGTDKLDVNVEEWNTTAVPSEHTAGYPIVTVKDGTGTGELDTASGVVLAKDHGGNNLALASTAAAIEADTQDIQSRLPAALTAGGNIKADVLAISGDATAADNLETAADGGSFNLGGGGVVAASVTGAVGSVTGAVGSVASGGISSASFASGAITADAIAANAIGASEIADGAIDAGAIADGAITAAKIADGAIDAATFAAGAITATVIATDAIDNDAIAANAVTEIQSGLATASALTTLSGLVDDLESRLGTPSNLGSGATIAANLVDIEGQTDDIGTAGAGLTAVPWNAAWDAEVQSEVQDAIEANHLDRLLAAAYDPASKPGHAEALLNELVENDGGVSRYTANALEQAPSGGSAPTVTQIRQEMDTNSTKLANLDATMSSRASQTSLDTLDNFVDSEVAAIQTVTDRLSTALEQDGAVYRFTTNALEQGPGGGSEVVVYGEDGIIPFTYTVYRTGGVLPLPGAAVYVSADSDGEQRSATKTTDAVGNVVFSLNAGTHYFWVSHPDYTFSNPDSEVVS